MSRQQETAQSPTYSTERLTGFPDDDINVGRVTRETMEEIPPWLQSKFETEFLPSILESMAEPNLNDHSQEFQRLEICPETGEERNFVDRSVAPDVADDAHELAKVGKSSMKIDPATLKLLLQAASWGHQEGLKSWAPLKATTAVQAQADAFPPSGEIPNSQGYTSWVEKRLQGNQLVANFFKLDHQQVLVHDIRAPLYSVKTVG
ncbi:hypothetical protein ACMFMG_009256 [Clarireedia jacksonii]